MEYQKNLVTENIDNLIPKESMRHRQMKIVKKQLEQEINDPDAAMTTGQKASNSISHLVHQAAKDHKLLKMVVDEANSRGMAITSHQNSTDIPDFYSNNFYRQKLMENRRSKPQLIKPYEKHRMQIKSKSVISNFNIGKQYYNTRIRPIELANQQYDYEMDSLVSVGYYQSIPSKRPNFYMDHRQFTEQMNSLASLNNSKFGLSKSYKRVKSVDPHNNSMFMESVTENE